MWWSTTDRSASFCLSRKSAIVGSKSTPTTFIFRVNQAISMLSNQSTTAPCTNIVPSQKMILSTVEKRSESEKLNSVYQNHVTIFMISTMIKSLLSDFCTNIRYMEAPEPHRAPPKAPTNPKHESKNKQDEHNIRYL